jgi:two-component system cell cycle response regulator CtrA
MPAKQVLIVEDERPIREMIAFGLKRAGFEVREAEDCRAARALLADRRPDLVLVDWMLPDMSGLELTRALKRDRETREVPIIMLTARSEEGDKVAGLEGGADDYVTKPFHHDELVARIHAIVRRSKGHSQSTIRTGDIVVNLDGKTVEVKGERVHLTGKEYQMLELLSLRKGTTLTKEMFLNHLYGGMDEPELKIIDVFICKLRKKLKMAASDHCIETVWGRGYMLQDPREKAPA